MKWSLRFVRSQYATSWWQAVLIWLAMVYAERPGFLRGRPRPAIGDVFGEGKNGYPFLVMKARVLDIRGKYIKYRIEFPEDAGRPSVLGHLTISDFMRQYPVKEN